VLAKSSSDAPPPGLRADGSSATPRKPNEAGLEDLAVLGIRPAIHAESEPFWAAAAAGDLVVEQCGDCGLHIFPPRGVCRHCYSRNLGWVALSPPATLYSYTVNHHPWAPEIGTYAVGIAEFADYSGVRFVGMLTGFEVEPEIGQLLAFEFSESLGGLSRVHFLPWQPA
jgi:uncharacterized OB-fold protein